MHSQYMGRYAVLAFELGRRSIGRYRRQPIDIDHDTGHDDHGDLDERHLNEWRG